MSVRIFCVPVFQVAVASSGKTESFPPADNLLDDLPYDLRHTADAALITACIPCLSEACDIQLAAVALQPR